MGLTMNVLLSIVVFLLLVSKRLPPTSNSIPLVAKVGDQISKSQIFSDLVSIVDIFVERDHYCDHCGHL